MKKIIFILLVNAIFNLHAYDLFTPKINHGTLEKLEIHTISSILGISEEEVYAKPPKIDNFGSIDNEYYYEYIYTKSMNPKGFYKHVIAEENLAFFRIIYEVELVNKWSNWITTYQRIYYKNEETKEISLSYEDFMNYEIIGRQLSTPNIRKGVMLILRNGQYDGLMIYRLWKEDHYRMEYDDDEPGEALFPDSVNNKHEAFVFFFGEGEKKIIPGARTPDISIEASTPLLDWNDLFKYTIQNAFDQNPATSYVEDTEDDLMEVVTSFSNNLYQSYVSRGILFTNNRIINGYAQSISSYKSNNRIRVEKNNILQDMKLEFQVNSRPKASLGLGHRIIVKEIYNGTLYNDTCIAEYDWQLNTGEWLFGGFDE